MSKIDRIRLFHELTQKFKVSKELEKSLFDQLEDDAKSNVNRFMDGFKIEDWFESIFCVLPWSILIHGLIQEQLPSISKSKYQVPDYLALIETSSMDNKPILVEVKSVTKQKRTLKLPESQMSITEEYSVKLGMPLLYAVYWEIFNAWTINTPDSFEKKASSRKLSIDRALQLNCSLIFGDVFFLISKELRRILVHNSSKSQKSSVYHKKHGSLISDTLIINDKEYELASVESAAMDSMFTWTETNVQKQNGETTLVLDIDNQYVVKMSTWITRHLAIFSTSPSEVYAKTSAFVIHELCDRIGIQKILDFPAEGTEQIKLLNKLFFSK